MNFAVRACMSSSDGGMCDEFAHMVPRNAILTSGATPSQFDKMYAWLTLAQRRPINSWFTVINGSTTEFASTTVSVEATKWTAEPSAEQTVDQLESYVGRLRNARKEAHRLSYLAPQLVGLSRDGLAHIADVVDHPFSASLLLQETGGHALKTISDEIARSRIMDCARLHGSLVEADAQDAAEDKTDLERIAACAGVEAPTDDVLIACLNGGHCLPERTPIAVAALMSIQSAIDVKEMALSTAVPRIGRAIATTEAYEALARTCAANKDKWDAMNCVLKGSMSAKDYEIVDCVQAAGKVVSDPGRVMDCAMTRLPGLSEADRARYDCIRRNAQSPTAAVGCAALVGLPEDLQAAVSCAEKVDLADRKTILAQCGSLFGAKWAGIADCVANADTTAKRLWCAAKPNLPPEAQDVAFMVECAGGSDDWKKYAACGIQQKVHLKGPMGQALSCGLSNGGVNLGTAVCMANLSKHLTQDQAIVLQCASSSPDLTSFAACAGGQMTVNFLMACRNAHFGSDDKCFGPNNEIRRALRALGLEGIVKTGSPIARYMDLEVKIVWLQYAVAEKGLRELGNAIQDVGHAVENLGNAIGDGVKHFGHEAEKFARKIFGGLF